MAAKIQVFNDSFKITKAAVGGDTVTIHFTVNSTQIRQWEFMFVVGSTSKLGMWNPENALEMIKDNKKP